MTDLVFVYGTLRRDPGHEMYRELARKSVFVGEGRVGGILLDLGDYPGIVPPETDEDVVLGEVYRMEQPSETLAVLDEYEGCGPEDPLPHEFVRREEGVEMRSGEVLRAWVYWFEGDAAKGQRVPSGDYLNRP